MEWVDCNLCGSREAVELYPARLPQAGAPGGAAHYRCTSPLYRQHHAIVRCSRCGLVYANPRPTPQEILQVYQDVEDPLYLQEEMGRLLTFRRHMQAVERVVGPPLEAGRLLDVGCYLGCFLQAAQEQGWEAWGVEPSHWAATEAARRGLTVVEGTLAEVAFPAGLFDVVTLWDVAEHLLDPRAAFAEAWRVLRPGGWVVVHTMDVESWPARLLGPYWPWWMEMHLYYFSPRTLERMLQEVGFTPVQRLHLARYLRLGYLASRLASFSSTLVKGLQWGLEGLGLAQVPMLIHAADLFTCFAQKEGM